MTRFILLLILFVVIARTFWRFFDSVLRGAMGPAPQSGRRPGQASAVKMQQCPVCGTYVVPGKAISLVSNGAPIYFDSEQCRTEYRQR
ncbi:MAG TPA: hypothetical protein VEC39_04660 [Vicinamibacterales bacterium]|nr:hypothetical protein [Vicinamibacterales bacterium]